MCLRLLRLVFGSLLRFSHFFLADLYDFSDLIAYGLVGTGAAIPALSAFQDIVAFGQPYFPYDVFGCLSRTG